MLRPSVTDERREQLLLLLLLGSRGFRRQWRRVAAPYWYKTGTSATTCHSGEDSARPESELTPTKMAVHPQPLQKPAGEWRIDLPPQGGEFQFDKHRFELNSLLWIGATTVGWRLAPSPRQTIHGLGL